MASAVREPRPGIVSSKRVFVLPLRVVTRAIVATGSYASRGFAPEVQVPQRAEEADGAALPRVVWDQISKGADWIKVYADYRWGPQKEARPTFSVEELTMVRPQDLTATIFHCLGYRPETEIHDPLGRPIPISRGQVIRQAIG